MQKDKKYYLIPFGTDEYVTYFTKEYLYDFVKTSLPEENQLIFIDKEHLQSLQSDDRSCHTMALVNSYKTMKKKNRIKEYLSEIASKSEVKKDKEGRSFIKTDLYYPIYIQFSQSISRVPEDQRKEIKEKYIFPVLMKKSGETKEVNTRLQLKTSRFNHPNAEKIIKELDKIDLDPNKAKIIGLGSSGYMLKEIFNNK